MNEVCRTCLISSQDMCPLFNENVSQVETESHDAADLLKMFTSVQINNDNGFPDKICIECLDEIRRAYSFKLKCEKSQVILQQLKDVKVNLKQFKEDQNEIQDESNGKFQSDCKQDHDINEKDDSNSINSAVQDIAIDCEQNKSTNDAIDKHLINVLQEDKLPCKQNDTINDESGPSLINFTKQGKGMNSERSYKTSKIEFVNEKSDANLINTPVRENACDRSSNRDVNLVSTVEINASKSGVQLHQTVPSTHHIKKEPVDHTAPDYCVKIFKSEPELDIDVNAEDVNWDVHDIKDTEVFECAACTKVFQSLEMFRDHMVTEHFEDKLCKLCNEEFECSQFEHLTNHLPTNYFHQFDYEYHDFSDSKGENFENIGSFCEHCLKHFQDLKILQLHVAVEHNARIEFKCRLCLVRLPNNGLLSLHMKNVHNDEKPFICELCQLQFQQWFTLKYHLRTNHAHEISAVNILQCQVCAKILPNKSRFAEHMRCHTGESPFKCNLCPEKFRYNKGLKSHMRKKHSTEFTGGMQNYQCNICTRIFGYKDHLARHMRVHTSDKPFKCEICLKQFRCKRSCKLHTLTHIPSEIEIGMRRSARKSCTTTNE